MNIRDGLIQTFEPRFDSIDKDCGRYSDTLIEMVEGGSVKREDYFELNSSGSLWIVFQYIECGFWDAVEKHLIRGETSRDIYGPLHKNSHLTLRRLTELGAARCVENVYRAAIDTA